MDNKTKGDLYEKYILNYILNEKNNEAWLWPNIPEKELINIGLIHDQNQHRLNKKYDKINNILTDTGIDIIEKYYNNELNKYEYIAVQCKNGYVNGLSINLLGSFYFMMYNYDNLKYGHLYYTNKLHYLLQENTVNKNITFIKKQIDDEQLITLNPNLFELYNYQCDAIHALNEYYKSNTRGILTLPCGLGKTLITAYYSCKSYKHIIILSPLRQFALQNMNKYIEYFNYLKETCVLIDCDGTRNIDDIVDFIQYNNDKQLLFSSTYRSVDVINKLLKYLDDVIIIIDEYHNLSTMAISDNNNEFNKLLTSNHKILFVSATPRIYDIKNNDDLNVSSILGNIIYKMNFNDAINNKYMCDYKIFIPSITLDNTLLYNDIDTEIGINDINNKYKAKSAYLFKCLTYYGSRKCIIYCNNNKDLTDLKNAINLIKSYYVLDDIWIDEITATTSHKNRIIKLNQFTNNTCISLLFSIEILNECIDIPACDSIFISYQTSSKITTIQRMCRATRIDKNNPHKVAHIYMWTDEHNDILDILDELKEYDIILLHKINIQSSKLTHETNEEKTIITNEQQYIDNYIIDVKEFKQLSWMERYNSLVEYIETYNKLPTEHISNPMIIIKMSKWMSDQRLNYKTNKKIVSQNKHYNELFTSLLLKYPLLFNSDEEVWYNNLNKLIEFIDKYNKLPCARGKTKDEQVIGTYKDHNTHNYKYKIHAMSNEIIYNDWSNIITCDKYRHLFTTYEEDWLVNFNKLKTYINENNCLPSKSKDKSFYGWISTQIQNYKKNVGVIKKPHLNKMWSTFMNDNKYRQHFKNYKLT